MIDFPNGKINLGLHVTSKRQDGFHNLESIFYPVKVNDALEIIVKPGSGKVNFQTEGLPIGGDVENNLIVKAVKNFGVKTFDYEIFLLKKIPMGGGLGGGSSNAATTLMVLNHLWGLGLSTQQLMQIGLGLGADVPIFVFGYSAWAEGVGEQLQAIEVPERWLVIIKPDCHVDTGEIFSHKDLTRNSKSIKIADFLEGQHQNDCMDVVRKLYQPVDKALSDLSKYAEARLTGTGACVFAEFDQRQDAMLACNDLSAQWQVFVAKGMNRSLLLDLLI